PAEAGSRAEIFTVNWQAMNAGIYGWIVLLVSSASGLFTAWLLARFTGFGVLAIVGGIVLSCMLTKGAASAVMAMRYGGLRRKLTAKLGVDGQLVGLAPDGEARAYNGYRFADAGLLRFENGRLLYESERSALALNPADVAEVGMVAAAPANWFRKRTMMRFRNPATGQMQSLILHAVGWFAVQGKLLRSIERWRAGEISGEATSVRGLEPIASEMFRKPTVARAARGFVVIGIATQLAAMVTAGVLRLDWRYEAWGLAFTACAYAFMLLPAMLYRAPGVGSGKMERVETE
ncbi:MAG: hypothetical protein ACRD3S_00665, partial [Terracidiphilus sp.]